MARAVMMRSCNCGAATIDNRSIVGIGNAYASVASIIYAAT